MDINGKLCFSHYYKDAKPRKERGPLEGQGQRVKAVWFPASQPQRETNTWGPWGGSTEGGYKGRRFLLYPINYQGAESRALWGRGSRRWCRRWKWERVVGILMGAGDSRFCLLFNSKDENHRVTQNNFYPCEKMLYHSFGKNLPKENSDITTTHFLRLSHKNVCIIQGQVGWKFQFL